MYMVHLSPSNNLPVAAFQLLSDAISHLEQPKYNKYRDALIRDDNNNVIYSQKDKFFAAYNLFSDKLTITL